MSNFEEMYNIQIRPGKLKGADAVHYYYTTARALEQIFFADSGRELLYGLKKSNKWTWIEPYDQSNGSCSAAAKGVDQVDKSRRHFMSRVLFTADAEQASPCAQLLKNAKTNRGRLPHELLHHELIHSLRMVTGQWTSSSYPLGIDPIYGRGYEGLRFYNNVDEFYAVVLSNIYITDETNKADKSGLRADHATWSPLEDELSGSFEFFQSGPKTFTLIDQFCTKNADYAKGMSRVRAKFNPIAAYYQNKEKAQAMSKSPEAATRGHFQDIGILATQIEQLVKRLEGNLNRLEQNLTKGAPKH